MNKISMSNELDCYIHDIECVRVCLDDVRKEMLNTPHTNAPCNSTALLNLWEAIQHLRDAERLIETAKRYDPEAEEKTVSSACYACKHWQGTCDVKANGYECASFEFAS